MQDIPAVGPCPDADQPKYLPNWIRNALSCNSRYSRMIQELDVFSSDFCACPDFASDVDGGNCIGAG
jgi:hypothetical protein